MLALIAFVLLVAAVWGGVALNPLLFLLLVLALIAFVPYGRGRTWW